MKKTKNVLELCRKDVMSLNAPTNKVCVNTYEKLGTYDWAQTVTEQLAKQSKELSFIFILQFETGARISEILSILPDNIYRDGSVKICGKKGSNDRIINSSQIAGYLLKCRENNKKPFSSFNRFFVYRCWKNSGIVFQSENSTKKSVTHALRQLKAETIRINKDSDLMISETIGQKNSKNARYYGKGKKQK